MRNTRKNQRKKKGLYTQGELNKLVDSLCHPFFDANKGAIVADGILHSLVEQNLPVSLKKFLRYNLLALVTPPQGPRHTSGTRRRHYHCRIPLRRRHTVCNSKRAGPSCLRRGRGRAKCPELVVSYERTP